MKSSKIPALADLTVQKIAHADRFMTTTRFPVIYQPITKCGCTFMKSLLYRWEFGHAPEGEPSFAKIPRTEGWTQTQLMQAQHKVVVIRDPVARFFSLYFDKILGVGQKEPHAIHHLFCDKLKLVDPAAGTNIDLHKQNCNNAIRWIRRNLNGQTARKPNWHWRPQVSRLKRLRDYDFDVVMLEDLASRLPELWGDVVDARAVDMMTQRPVNQSSKPVKTQEIEDAELRQKIEAVYRIDKAIYDQVKASR